MSCIVAFHVDYLYILALSYLHLDSCLSHLLTMSSAKSTLQSLSLCNLTHLFTRGKNIPLSVNDQFRHLALNIGKFPLPGTTAFVLGHSFFPLYYSILLFLFKLHKYEKYKKNYIFQKITGTGHYFHI